MVFKIHLFFVVYTLLLVLLARNCNSHNSEKLDADNYIKNLNIGKIIIDTDGGCDDAVALLLALKLKHKDILAITTTVGNTNRDQVIINVLKTLRVLDLKVPVYPGSENALLETPLPDYYYGKDGFGDVPDPNPPNITEASTENAVMKMIQLVNENPGNITIISIGPLTNIALAMRMNSKFKQNIQTIIWMGGSLQSIGNVKPGIEFNAYFDPAANFIVFNSTVNPIIMVTWELLSRNAPTTVEWRKEVLGKLKSPQIDFLNKIEEYSLNKYKRWVAADSKTVALALNTSLIEKVKSVYVEAIIDGTYTKGSFIADFENILERKPNAIVIQAMNLEGYKNILLEYLDE